jgi:sugar phosphate isomerase/epimerase
LQIYLSSACLWGQSLGEILSFASKAGFTGVEIWVEQLNNTDRPYKLKEQAQRLGLTLCVHATSWDLNICSMNPAIREVSIAQIKRSICTARDLGASNITMHPGRMETNIYALAQYQAMLAASLREICRFALRLGVTPSLELMEKIPKEFVVNPNEMNALLVQIAPLQCGVTLDVAHLDSADMFFHYLREMPNVDKIHLSNKNGTKLHTPVLDGDIDIIPVLEHLHTANLPVVIEGNGIGEEELVYMLQKIQTIKHEKAS